MRRSSFAPSPARCFFQGFLDGDLDHLLREGLLQRLEDDLIEDLLFDEERVFADRRAAIFVIAAAVEPPLSAVVILPDDLHRTAAMGAPGHAGEEILRFCISEGRP